MAVLCSLGCKDKDGNPRTLPPNSEFTICEVCRANIAGWSRRRLIEAKSYADTLDVRVHRLHEVTDATAKSYVAQLKAKRRRRQH